MSSALPNIITETGAHTETQRKCKHVCEPGLDTLILKVSDPDIIQMHVNRNPTMAWNTENSRIILVFEE